jgi:hypothetical protein
MKNRFSVNLNVATITLAICLSVFFVYATGSAALSGLLLRGKTDKLAYILGEPVRIQFEFVNESGQSQIIPGGGFEVGSLKLYVSKDNEQNYKEYFGPGWGRLRGQRKALSPGASYSFESATLLWNGKPRVSHLDPAVAERVLAGKISTEYLFPEAGVYYIKGVSFVGENFVRIESEPVKIEIKEPVGENLEVWSQIRGNREIALLMQEGAFDSDNDNRKQELVATVERIVSEYPNSVYSGYLKRNLEKFKSDEVKRREALERAIKPGN